MNRRRFMSKSGFKGEPYLDSLSNIKTNTSGSYTLDKTYRYADILFVGFGGSSKIDLTDNRYATGGGGSGSLVQLTRLNLQKMPVKTITYNAASRILVIGYNGKTVSCGSGSNGTAAGGDGGITNANDVKNVFGDYQDTVNILCVSNGGGAAGAIYAQNGGASGASCSSKGNDGTLSGGGTSVSNNNGVGGFMGGKSGAYSAGKGYRSVIGSENTLQLTKFGGGGDSGKGGNGGKSFLGDNVPGGGGGAAGYSNGGNGGDSGFNGGSAGIGGGVGGKGGDSNFQSGDGGNAGIFIYYYNK